MNQPQARVSQPYATLTLASPLREMFGVQLYKNNARALLWRILSILNLDWLHNARSVRGVYEYPILHMISKLKHYFFSYYDLSSVEPPNVTVHGNQANIQGDMVHGNQTIIQGDLIINGPSDTAATLTAPGLPSTQTCAVEHKSNTGKQ